MAVIHVVVVELKAEVTQLKEAQVTYAQLDVEAVRTYAISMYMEYYDFRVECARIA